MLTIAVILSSLGTKACGCISFGIVTVQNSMKATDAVFIGKVISKKIALIEDPLYIELNIKDMGVEYDRITFEVNALYKGKIKKDTVSVYTTTNYRAGCGYKFDIGSTYVIYANYRDRFYNGGPKVKKFLETNTCKRTRPATDVNEIVEIEKYYRNRKKKS